MLESKEQIIEAVKGLDECYIIRNVSGDDSHYIEDWDNGDPKIIDISEDAYMDCFNDEDLFRKDWEMSIGDEYYIFYIGD